MARQNASPVRYRMNQNYSSPYSYRRPQTSKKASKNTEELNLTVDLPVTQQLYMNEENPRIIEAREEMNCLSKASITEIKSMNAPPQLVKIVLEAV